MMLELLGGVFIGYMIFAVMIEKEDPLLPAVLTLAMVIGIALYTMVMFGEVRKSHLHGGCFIIGMLIALIQKVWEMKKRED